MKQINSCIKKGTTTNLASPSEDNCKFCDCRHLCSSYWKSPFLQSNYVKGKIKDSGKNFVSLVLENGTIVRVTGIEKLKIPTSELYSDRQLMFLEVLPSQQTIGQFVVTKHTLVYDYPVAMDPNAVYYENYLPELHTFVKIVLEKGLNISKDGGYFLLDDEGVIIAEAGLGVESKKVVVMTDSVSESIFKMRGYKIYNIN